MNNPLTCPYLKEVVMLYCDACAYRKMVPLNHLASASPCLVPDYKQCPLYLEVYARQGGVMESGVNGVPPVFSSKEVHS